MEISIPQYLSIIVTGCLATLALAHVFIFFVSQRKNLHALFILASLSLIFILVFQVQSSEGGVFRNTNSDFIRSMLFFCLNIYCVSIQYIFAVMPKYRHVNRRILTALGAIIMLVCIAYIMVDNPYKSLLRLLTAVFNVIYIGYVMYHIVRIIHNRNSNIIFIFVTYTLYTIFIIFVIFSNYHYESNSNCWINCSIGCIFLFVLSLLNSLRKFINIGNSTVIKSGISSNLSKEIDNLEESNASKDRFISIIAHDLKTPISSIKTLSDIYLEESTLANDVHSVELATAMRDSVDNLYKLLENLLTWSRTQLGTIQCNPQYIDISTLIKQVKNSVNLICVSKNISIKTTINGNDKIYADYNMIQTILRNLLTNAIKFSYADSYIELTFDSDQTDTIITVSDNGVGMNAETIECLFKIDKVNPTIGTRKEQGTGLGLILCNEFVKKHNGTITISAEEGLGTKIIVKLPLKK